jgi:hypothetical protein
MERSSNTTAKAKSAKNTCHPEQMRHEAAASTAGSIPPGARRSASRRKERPGGVHRGDSSIGFDPKSTAE